MAARKPSGWAIMLICVLLAALTAVVWSVVNRTAIQAEEVVLTVPPVDIPDRVPVPPEPPRIPTPGPT